jgi:hypothetical protein
MKVRIIVKVTTKSLHCLSLVSLLHLIHRREIVISCSLGRNSIMIIFLSSQVCSFHRALNSIHLIPSGQAIEQSPQPRVLHFYCVIEE